MTNSLVVTACQIRCRVQYRTYASCLPCAFPPAMVTMYFVWQNDALPAPGSAHAELLTKYGLDTEGYVFELTRGNKNFRIDLE